MATERRQQVERLALLRLDTLPLREASFWKARAWITRPYERKSKSSSLLGSFLRVFPRSPTAPAGFHRLIMCQHGVRSLSVSERRIR
jgi:hypothetical protein